MSQDGDADGESEILGLSVEQAAEQVAPTVDGDVETVRTTLRTISEDGTVTSGAVQDALADVSKVVATPETRVELAHDALTAAREAATPVADTDVVDSQLAAFEAELSDLDERVDTLGSRLSELVDRDDAEDLYAVATSIRQLRADATDAQNAADALADEIKGFTRKLDDLSVWAGEIREDVDTLEASLEGLREAVDRLVDDGVEDAEPPIAWADIRLQYRVQELIISDIHAELDALETLGDETGTETPADDIRTRLDELASLQTDITEGLDDAFDATWDPHYNVTVESFDQALAAFEPPVPWAELQNELKRHQNLLTREQ